MYTTVSKKISQNLVPSLKKEREKKKKFSIKESNKEADRSSYNQPRAQINLPYIQYIH